MYQPKNLCTVTLHTLTKFICKQNALKILAIVAISALIIDAVSWYWACTASVIGEGMTMEHWWNDTDRRRQRYLQETSLSTTFFHHKSHMDCSQIELMPP
jgi:hypothetical protein